MRSITIFLTLIIPIFCQAQKSTSKRFSREVILNSGDSIIVAHLSSEDMRINTSIKRTYYWYLRGKISHNTGDYSGKLLEDGYQVFLEDKMVLSGTFHNGIKIGKWMTWNSDGTINNVILYKKGNPRYKNVKDIWNTKRKNRQKTESVKKGKTGKRIKKNKQDSERNEENVPEELQSNNPDKQP